MYEALDTARTEPTDKVGIVGLGGLGHIAVMYAKAMGCEVVVISSTEAKRSDALALGAKQFIVMRKEGASKLEPIQGTGIKVLLLCGGALPDFEL